MRAKKRANKRTSGKRKKGKRKRKERIAGHHVWRAVLGSGQHPPEFVRGLHPALLNVPFTHRWGGPILIGEDWSPVFKRHPLTPQAIVLGAYSGHGVALSVYLGRWAAEAMLGRTDLPTWDDR